MQAMNRGTKMIMDDLRIIIRRKQRNYYCILKCKK